MISITLPDGSKKEFEGPVTVKEVAASIGAGLAKAAIAGKVNGKLVDTSYPITEDATLSIVTDKDPEGLDIIRHSTSHLMAQAVKEIFPSSQVTIGPVIENGFYYDFSLPRPLTMGRSSCHRKEDGRISEERSSHRPRRNGKRQSCRIFQVHR